MKITIALDVDGVLARLHDEWLRRYNRDWDDNLQVEQITEWEIHKLVKPECGTHIYKYLDDTTIYDHVLPEKDAQEVVQRLRADGHRVVLATTSTPKSMGRKYAWAKHYGLVESTKDYIEVGDKGLLRADVLLDDYIGNLEAFKGWSVIYNQPWNKINHHTLGINLRAIAVTRVLTLSGFYDTLCRWLA